MLHKHTILFFFFRNFLSYFVFYFSRQLRRKICQIFQACQAVHLPEVVVVAQFSLLYAQGEMWPNSKAQGDLRYLNENSQSGRGDCSGFFSPIRWNWMWWFSAILTSLMLPGNASQLAFLKLENGVGADSRLNSKLLKIQRC